MNPPSASGRPRTRLDPDVRREQILDVATELFTAQEYSTVALESVAQRAGVTRGLLHHYFGSKRLLYTEVIRRAVQIPAGVRLVPPGATGDLREVIAECVASWMHMVETTGGLWARIADTGGVGGADVDDIIVAARDDLVERMIEEVPFPEDLDRDALRSALRAFAAMARVATGEWLLTGDLDRRETETLLRVTLLALVEQVVPAMGEHSDD